MNQLSTDEKHALVAAAQAAADVAQSITLSYFRGQNLNTQNKAGSGFDPVTMADQEAEQAIRASLKQSRPKDAIQGEEFGYEPGTTGLTWVLDPIDGTRGYMSGTPTWGTLISVRDDTGPLMGLIDQPYIGERFIGGFGIAELRRGDTTRPLETRLTQNLSEAVLFSTFPEVGTNAEFNAFQTLSKRALLTRYGMDCYAYGLLAAGYIDLVVEAGLFPYDVQAPIAVIQAAGGIVTDWHGNPGHEGGQILAAANRALHEQAIELLNAP